MRYFRVFTMGMAASVFLFAGCSGPSTPTQVAPAQALPGRDSDSSAPTISEAEAEEFADQWVDSIVSDKPNAGARLIMMDQILDRALGRYSLSKKFKSNFRKGVASSNPIQGLITQLNSSLKLGGSYEKIGSLSRDGRRHVLFRLLGPEGTINYHDLRLIQSGSNLRADQVFFATTGETLADTMSGMLAPIVSSQSAMGRLTGQAKKSQGELVKASQMMKLLRKGETARVLGIYETLSDSTKKMKLTQIARLSAYARTSEDLYLTALDEYESLFPKDPSLALMTLDMAVMRKDSARLMKSYQALQDWMGGDDYLSLMIASLIASFEKFDEAAQIFGTVPADQVDTLQKCDLALGYAMTVKDNKLILQYLRKMRDQFNYRFPDLGSAAGFEEFAKSPEFKIWQSEMK